MKEIVFLGDTNCDLLSDRVHMKELYDSFGFKQLIDKATRKTIKTKTTLLNLETLQNRVFTKCVLATIIWYTACVNSGVKQKSLLKYLSEGN